MKQKLVVIGHGKAGARAVEEILARGGRDRFEITLLRGSYEERIDRGSRVVYGQGGVAVPYDMLIDATGRLLQE